MEKIQLLCYLLLFSCIWHMRSMAKSVENSRDDKPNIVFILADDLGWVDLPSNGNTFNKTQNLTKLAHYRMQFTSAYAANPVCSATPASILGGAIPVVLSVEEGAEGSKGHITPSQL